MNRRRHRLHPPSSPGSPWAWAGIGALLGLVGTLLTQAPARWLAAALDTASEGRVVMSQVRGTVWQGSSELTLTGGAGSRDAVTLPGTVHWTLAPRWTGLHLQLQAPCCTPTGLQVLGELRWGGLRLGIADGQSRWPAGLLTGLGTPWNTLQPEGQLALSTTGLTLDSVEGRWVVGGGARLEARDISSRLSTLRPMGSYRLTLQGGSTSTLQLDTLDGSLQLSGAGEWVGSRLRFQGQASAAPEREEALSNLLNIIGRRNGARSIITVG